LALRTVVVATALVALMVWVIAYRANLTNAVAQLSTLPGPKWSPILIAVGAVVASYGCSAVALSAAAGRRLPFGRTLLVQFAAAAANRLTPGGVGGVAVNARYLRTQELPSGDVVAALSLSAMAHIAIATVGILAMGPAMAKLPLAHSLLRTRIHGVPVIVAVLVAVLLIVSSLARAARSRLPVGGRMLAAIRDARTALSSASRQPKRLALLLGATAGVKATNLLALLAATWAFDGDIADWRIAVVYLVGVPVAEAIPTPGGIGGVDAVLVAGLARIGTSTAGAVVAAVIVFRLLTFWAPIVPGTISASLLRRQHAL
ncbi:MAG TPA: lysylphosphatidylglycerol synthase transmembrane domain-containing protein, partial [Acidothermaceae bacterium]|nr:lysylphosphatidylglycerol synthase transmembrane domain-containing protein [Acidothermaceae bacterium]